MQINESTVKTFEGDRPRQQVAYNDSRYGGKAGTSMKQEAIDEAVSSTSRISPGESIDSSSHYEFVTLDPQRVINSYTDFIDTPRVTPSGLRGSPELTRTMSRTEAVRQDVRRLKSVTLDRIGKMFKTRTTDVGRSSSGSDANVISVGNYDVETSRKEKTNSLGRILKLVDKDGSPKKLFVRPRAGSLSRILRRHPHNEDNGVIDKSAEDAARGILSRMLSQLRGKSRRGWDYRK